jgi:hypothetical protein
VCVCFKNLSVCESFDEFLNALELKVDEMMLTTRSSQAK